MTAAAEFAYLVVNADDYGYFRCVSQGILRSVSHGIVTATGVLANTSHFEDHAAWLRNCEAVDVGVHLNLTDGAPLTAKMRGRLSRWAGQFPGKYGSAIAVLTGAIKAEDVKLEWGAQIERCLASGLNVRFINSHEHLHMLPSLFPVARMLAKEYRIPHIRFPTSELSWSSSKAALFRGTLLNTLAMLNRRHMDMPAAQLLGMEHSGKLNLGSLERTVSTLRRGRIYELMCHPGQQHDQGEVHDPRLLDYHDWQGELNTLTSPAAKEVLHRYRVRLIGYRHLEVEHGRLIVRQEATASA